MKEVDCRPSKEQKRLIRRLVKLWNNPINKVIWLLRCNDTFDALRKTFKK